MNVATRRRLRTAALKAWRRYRTFACGCDASVGLYFDTKTREFHVATMTKDWMWLTRYLRATHLVSLTAPKWIKPKLKRESWIKFRDFAEAAEREYVAKCEG